MFGFMKKKSSDAAEAKQKKSKGYYLELDEAKSVGTAPAPKAAPESPTPEVVVSEPVQTEVTSSEARTDAALVVPAKAPQTEAKASKPEAKPAAAKATKPESKPESKPAPEPVAIATPEILPAYLQPNDTPRRRPGANMAMFKNMAQQIKNP